MADIEIKLTTEEVFNILINHFNLTQIQTDNPIFVYAEGIDRFESQVEYLILTTRRQR